MDVRQVEWTSNLRSSPIRWSLQASDVVPVDEKNSTTYGKRRPGGDKAGLARKRADGRHQHGRRPRQAEGQLRANQSAGGAARGNIRQTAASGRIRSRVRSSPRVRSRQPGADTLVSSANADATSFTSCAVQLLMSWPDVSTESHGALGGCNLLDWDDAPRLKRRACRQQGAPKEWQKDSGRIRSEEHTSELP